MPDATCKRFGSRQTIQHIGKVRCLAGWAFVLVVAFPYLFSAVVNELTFRFMCACEATAQWIWDREPWREAYRREMENG